MDSPPFRQATEDDDVYIHTICCADGYLDCPMGESPHYHCPNCGAVTGDGQHFLGAGRYSCKARRA